MLVSEEILEERRNAYEEQQRVLLAKTMSEKGGILMKGATNNEIEGKATEFFRNLQVLDAKYIDIVREDWGLDPNDETATFGDDFENRWDHFIKNHRVLDENEQPTILYKDKDEKLRLIPGKYPDIKDMKYVIDRFDEILLADNEREEVDTMPSVTILGIEGLSGETYEKYNKDPKDKDFFVTQIMILTGELLDVLSKHKEELKEGENELFKVLEQKYKEIF